MHKRQSHAGWTLAPRGKSETHRLPEVRACLPPAARARFPSADVRDQPPCCATLLHPSPDEMLQNLQPAADSHHPLPPLEPCRGGREPIGSNLQCATAPLGDTSTELNKWRQDRRRKRVGSSWRKSGSWILGTGAGSFADVNQGAGSTFRNGEW